MSKGKLLRKTRSKGICHVHGSDRLKNWGHRRCSITEEIDRNKHAKARTIDKKNVAFEIELGLEEYTDE